MDTSSATRSYFERHSSIRPLLFGRTGWWVSPVGFGGYRVSDQGVGADAHREALREALLSGCNLIDTSTNYTDGGSERLVGQVLAELFAAGKLGREEVVVVTKAGYVQGENLRLARDRAAKNIPFDGMVEYSDDCWHCISPEFLRDQITRSLSRLGLERIDVLLLHNPEYFLKARAGDPDAHREYYERIEAAFAHLETEVRAGRIQCYGISSNTFPEPKDARDYTSLEVAWELAEEQAKDHHFSVIQFPFNLHEPGAALEENNRGLTVAEFARSKGLGTLVNRPLNAFANGRLIRLADFPHHLGEDVVGEFKESMTRATSLEARYPGRALVAAKRIAWGHILRENFAKLSDLDTWKHVLSHQILPSLEEAFDILSDAPECRAWVEEYREASSRLFEAFNAYLESQASAESDRIAGKLDHLCPELHGSETLSQKAIRLYRSIPGIDCILVGMRHTQYVRDVLADVSHAGLPNAETARRALLEFARETS